MKHWHFSASSRYHIFYLRVRWISFDLWISLQQLTETFLLLSTDFCFVCWTLIVHFIIFCCPFHSFPIYIRIPILHFSLHPRFKTCTQVYWNFRALCECLLEMIKGRRIWALFEIQSLISGNGCLYGGSRFEYLW